MFHELFLQKNVCFELFVFDRCRHLVCHTYDLEIRIMFLVDGAQLIFTDFKRLTER